MHYYTFYAKDYLSKTHFLEPMEDLAYRRMLDYYYLEEKPLPCDIEEIAMLVRMRTHTECIANVLRLFFELTESGYINKKAEFAIEDFHNKKAKAKASADARWSKVKAEKNKKPSKDKPVGDVCESNANALQTECETDANYKLLTKNQELNNNVNSVFLFWKETFSKSDRTKLQGVRETKIKARLNEGYSVEDIKKAIFNVSQSKYHTENGYTDIELICRDQVKLDKFIGASNAALPQVDVSGGEQQDQPVRKAIAVKKNYLEMEP